MSPWGDTIKRRGKSYRKISFLSLLLFDFGYYFLLS